MTKRYHLALIIETILALQIGTPISEELVMILLEPWPDLYRDAMDRKGASWINLLQAAAARLEQKPPHRGRQRGS
jgi:hypothetical protein